MAQLRILAVSLIGDQKHKAYAVYENDHLAIVAVVPIPGPFSAWGTALVHEVCTKKSEGFAVLVEEKTDLVARYATQYLLEDVEERSNLYDALDWYFGLSDMGNLILHTECRRFAIRAGAEGQKIQKKTDDKGRPCYDIDWRSFHGGYRAVLLCVVAAMSEPVSDRFLEAMYGGRVEESLEEVHPALRWQRKIFDHDVRRGLSVEAARAELAKITKKAEVC